MGETDARMIGGYRLIRELGAGSTGTVYLGEKEGAEAALRVLHRHLAMDPVIRERCRREFEQIPRHPGIVAIYDLLDWDTEPAVVMEYCPAGSLEDRQPVDSDELAAMLRSVLTILQAAHSQGIIHRNLKPRNIFPIPGGGYKIGDFGSAHVQDLVGLTTSSMFMGSVEYMPPEALSGRLPDARWDIYSLGVIAYHAATGGIPSGDVDSDVLKRLPDRLAGLILDMLSPPIERPATATECLTRLEGRRKTGGESTKECLFCGAVNPRSTPVCFECTQPEPDLSYYDGSDAESLVLRRMPERADTLKEFIRVLRVLSGDNEYEPRLLLGDQRMYSREERRKGTRLPVRIVDNLRPESASILRRCIETGGRVRCIRYPQSNAAKKYKRGPLIWPVPGVVPDAGNPRGVIPAGRSGSISFLTQNMKRIREMREGPLKARFKRGLLGLYRLEQAFITHPLEADIAAASDRMVETLSRIVRRLEGVERYLSSVYLGEVYSELSRLLRTNSSDREIEHQRGIYRKYRELEQVFAGLTGLFDEYIGRIESLGAERLEDAESILQSERDMEREIARELGTIAPGVQLENENELQYNEQ